MTSVYHTPVLLEESVRLLDIDPAGTYVDLTFGGGGHSRRILSALGDRGRLYAFDQDRDTRDNCPEDSRFHYVESNFRFMRGALRLRGVTRVDGILADLGVSSHHFDAVERGFSFRGSAPLDMRMNQRGGGTAADLVNTLDADALTRILGDWGEIDTPWKVAACIVRARTAQPILTTADLVAAVAPCTPKKDESKFLTKLFQALRIEVNGEMEALKMALEQSLKVLRPGGRLVVISYHSLEDRLVKNFLRSGNFEGRIEKDFFGKPETPFEIITRKAVTPSSEELVRRIRREVLRVQSGEADEEIRADREREQAEEEARQEEQRKEERRRSNIFWLLFSGNILVRKGASEYYRYMICIAAMFFVSIFVMFTALHLDMKYSRLYREVQMLRERSTRLQEQRFRHTTHSAILEELRRRGIDLYDPVVPGEILDD